MFSKVTVLVYIPTSNVWEFQLFLILANTICWSFFPPSIYFFIKEKFRTTKMHLLSSAGFHIHLCCRNQDTEQFYHPKKPPNVLLWSIPILPGGPVVKTRTSKAGIVGSIPGCGARIPYGLQPKNQSKGQKQRCSKLIKEF